MTFFMESGTVHVWLFVNVFSVVSTVNSVRAHAFYRTGCGDMTFGVFLVTDFSVLVQLLYIYFFVTYLNNMTYG
jgi:hypothetical protein